MKDASRVISDVANPFVIFTVLYVLVALVFADGQAGAMLYLLVELTAAGVVAGYVFWMRRRRRVGDFWISSRRERLVPALVLLAAFVGLLLALTLLDAPPELFRLTLSMGLAAAVVAAVTTVWKASAHCAVAGHAAAAAIILFGSLGILFVIVLPLVVWARVALKAHTMLQAVVGAAVGVVSAVLFLI